MDVYAVVERPHYGRVKIYGIFDSELKAWSWVSDYNERCREEFKPKLVMFQIERYPFNSEV